MQSLIRALFVSLPFLGLSGCVYRFTNLHQAPPVGIRTIAVEAIFDTGRIPLPHEILWESLQTAFARNGRLIVVGQQSADAYLRVHLSGTSVGPTNTQTNPIKADPKTVLGNDGTPQSLTNYSNLHIADQYARNEAISYTVQVEVWNLKTHQKIFERSYPLSGTYVIYDGRTAPSAQFVKAIEGEETFFRAQSESVAGLVVRDFLSST